MMDCSNLKAGDRVWMGRIRNDSIKTVYKVTPYQIVIDLNGDGEYLPRYKKDSGYRLGGSYFSEQILALATADECAAWDAQEDLKRQQRERQKREEADTEKKRLELWKHLGGNDNISVGPERWGSSEADRKGRWTVEFHALTEEQVRALAEMRKP